MKLKICGMKYSENIVEVSNLLPDFMGFIFWKPSTRYFDNIIPVLPKSIQKVGVFVDATLNEIVEISNKHQLDFIQLHGKESPDCCNKLKSLNAKIIKVFSIDASFDFSQLQPYESVCDYYLFDTKGKLPGGNGVTFDWQILQNYKSSKPIFLSGGIGLEEIPHIQKLSLPIYAIDVNSKFEIEPGLKDIQKLQLFQNLLHQIS
jgi:phosphoribosylanthranilate isomerase